MDPRKLLPIPPPTQPHPARLSDRERTSYLLVVTVDTDPPAARQQDLPGMVLINFRHPGPQGKEHQGRVVASIAVERAANLDGAHKLINLAEAALCLLVRDYRVDLNEARLHHHIANHERTSQYLPWPPWWPARALVFEQARALLTLLAAAGPARDHSDPTMAVAIATAYAVTDLMAQLQPRGRAANAQT